MKINKNMNIMVIVVILLMTLTACSSGKNEMIAFLDEKEAIYEDISIQMGEAYWNLYSDEAPAKLETPKLRYVDLFSNDTLKNYIEEWYIQRNTIKDPIVKRRIEVWHNILTAAKVNYSKDNLKLQNELEFWLAENDSVVGKPSEEEMKSLINQLMKLRNKKAQELGYNNYGDLILEVTEIGSDWLENFAETINKRTLEPYKKLIENLMVEEEKTEFNNSEARSLMMQYYTNQITPDITGDSVKIAMKMIMDGIGIDYDNLPFRFIENEMPPGVGGQGIAVQIPKDFRIALLPNMGLSTWLHELGHGLQAMHTTIESPILKGYEWSLGSDCGGYAEGMAETSASFARNIDVVTQITGAKDIEFDKKIEKMNLYRSAYLRYWLAILMFEVEFYKDLDQNPDELKRQLIQKYLLLDNPPERVRSIVDIIYVSYPLYTQNYIIAEVLSWQVHETLKEKFGESYISNPAVGDFLKENFYKDGGFNHWQQRLKNVTGKELDLDGYLTHFGL